MGLGMAETDLEEKGMDVTGKEVVVMGLGG